MSKAKITPARAASLKAKTQSIASKLPATRNPNGSIKPRDKTGGKFPNSGKPWTASEDLLLREAVAAGDQVEKIAATFGRTPAGVKQRIETIGIFKAPAADATKAAATETKAPITATPGANGSTSPAADETKPVAEALAPAQSLDLPYKLLAAAAAVAPKDDTSHYLNGVFIHQLADDHTLRIVATDGHRMFVCSLAHDQAIDWARAGAIIPREELDRVLKYLGKKAPAVRVEFGAGHPAMFLHEIDGMARFQVRPIDGKFPDYQRVVDSAAVVFTQEREELSAVTLDSRYLKAAGALAAVLESKGIIPYLAERDSGVPNVFAFAEEPNALLYIMGQQNDRPALPASTIRLFGAEAMQATLAKLEEQIAKTRANAKAAKHEKFADQFTAKAERLQKRAEELRANLSVKLPAPKPAQSATVAVALASVH